MRLRPIHGALLAALALSFACPLVAADARAVLETAGMQRGILAVLGLPPEGSGLVVDVAKESELLVYFQAAEDDAVASVRRAAEKAGLLGVRIFVGEGDLSSVGLAANIAGAVLASPSARIDKGEVMRVLHPGGKAITKGLGGEVAIKPRPDGVDSWNHPFHRPDNNPQSTDKLARAPYLTQFLADPKFCPMPEISVAAGGRVFRAFGHIAHKANQNAMLNTLIAVNAYNGTRLWTRKLSEGFMIHRNTLVATPEYLYLADHESCKLIDAASGKVADEIVIPKDAADGPVWKWMAIEDGVLYALVGGNEVGIATVLSNRPGLGHWPWGMWKGHDYANPKTNFGFGRNFVAIDLESRKILWNHREEDYVDARGVCMRGGKIFFYSPEKHLAALDTERREIAWRTSDKALLAAIGKNQRAQHYVTGYATTTYIKCTDNEIFFAGPQRERLVVASAKDGYLLWQRDGGNLQLVLRDDGVYAAGPRATGVRLDYASGNVLGNLPTRRACTRATGSIDSVFYRTQGGTVRLDVGANEAKHIAPMRPPCQDGVIISDGYLYWGPWMCGCQLSLYGHISLGGSGDFDRDGPPAEQRLISNPSAVSRVFAPIAKVTGSDWVGYRGDSRRRGVTAVDLPAGDVERRWRLELDCRVKPTAPIALGDSVFFGDESGIVWRVGKDGRPKWKAHTGGAISFSPATDGARVFAGSADGWVYAFNAERGERLWRFRLAPHERRIPVYGRLVSTWPVAGGIALRDGVVYAAAGIAHYDGTHVAALDAETGRAKWYNKTSGTVSEKVASGVSLQGSLFIADGELRFEGGGVYKVARYDLETGRCLNTPHEAVTSRFQTAFYPYFPEYGQYQSFHKRYDDGRVLAYQAAYEGSRHSDLAMLAPPSAAKDDAGQNDGKTDRKSDRRTDRPSDRARARKEPAKLWSVKGERYHSVVAAPNAVLAAGQRGESAFLASIAIGKGNRVWAVGLEAPAVKGGTAVDRQGRVVVALQNGVVECYARSSD